MRSDAPIESRTFSAGGGAYEQWRDEALIPRVFEVFADPALFRNPVEYHALGSVLALRYETTGARHLRTLERARRDGLDMVWVQFVDAGGFFGSSPGQTTMCGPQTAGVCDFSVPLEQHCLASAGWALLLPRAAFGGLDPRMLHGAAVAGGRYALLRDYVRWLCANADRAASRDPAGIERAVAQVVASGFGSAPIGPDAAATLGKVALGRVRAFLAANLSAPDLRPEDVASAAGVSRATLYRLCAPFGGVAELLWSMRLEAVRKALSDPAETGRISDLAEAFGFTSPQHFSRRFKQAYGFSPRDLRPF